MRRVLVGSILFLALSACGGSDGPTNPNPDPDPDPPDPPPAGNTVTLNALSFSPATLTIDVGEAVTWNNGASITHTITPSGHTQWTEVTTSAAGQALQVTFNTAGTFPYLCEIHSGMTGSIVVE